MKKGTQKVTSENKKNILQKYNEQSTKGNIKNTLLKGAVDTVAGSVIGTGIGAFAGDKAALAGIALILAGHYIGDESGVLRLTGASAMAYGIGKSHEYKSNPEMKSISNRIGALKKDWLGAFFLKYKEEKKEVLEKKAPSIINDDMDIQPIRFNTEKVPTINKEITDLGGYSKFSQQEESETSNEHNDFDQLYGDDYGGIDLTLI